MKSTDKSRIEKKCIPISTQVSTQVNFDNVGFLYKFWYHIFITLEQILPFNILRKYIFKNTKSFSEKWVLVHTLLSLFSLVMLHYFSLGYISYFIVVYAFIRVLEIIIYQINVLLFHPYRTLVVDKEPQYKIQNAYRSIVLLGHNFLEVIFWFTSTSNFFNKPDDRLIYTLMDNTIRIFTLSYEKARGTNNVIQFVLFSEVICGIILTIISLAKFLGELPHQDIELESGE